ncbi:MAG TPA: hypothetical protein VMR23_01190 [Candidatus Limnocylindria bacterium]|nr:hypothetical protein [Candidatus Limnocylindria bacterium]
MKETPKSWPESSSHLMKGVMVVPGVKIAGPRPHTEGFRDGKPARPSPTTSVTP